MTFAFHNYNYAQLLRFFEQISKLNPALRSLKLLFDYEPLLDILCAQVFNNNPRPVESSSNYYFEDFSFTRPVQAYKCMQMRFAF